MEQFIFGLTVVMPIFVLIGLGAFLRQRNMISLDGFRQLNRLVFYILLPVNIFYSISHADPSHLIQGHLGLLILLGMVILFVLGMIIVPRLVTKPEQRGVIVQALFRGNFIILGFAILGRIYGDHGLDYVGVALLISIPVHNIGSVLALVGLTGQRPSLGAMMRRVITNPMIIATLLGLIALFIPLPSLIHPTLKMITNASGTMALITLGGLIELADVRSNWRILLSVSLLRLILIPLVIILIGYYLGLRDLALMTLMVFYASPVAVDSFAMVEQLGGDENLAGQLILVTTALSLFSYIWWIGVIRSLLV